MPIMKEKYYCEFDNCPNGEHGNYSIAFDCIEKAIKHEDSCPYNPKFQTGHNCLYGVLDIGCSYPLCTHPDRDCFSSCILNEGKCCDKYKYRKRSK